MKNSIKKQLSDVPAYIEKLREQRGELLAALEGMVDTVNALTKNTVHDGSIQTTTKYQAAISAIEKARGAK